MSAPSPIKAPWLKEPKFVYELMHNGWSKGVENTRNRFYCWLQFDRTVTPEEQEAYTNLIHAAPELLEALKAVVAIADRNTVEFNAARAAIRKAEGGES